MRPSRSTRMPPRPLGSLILVLALLLLSSSLHAQQRSVSSTTSSTTLEPEPDTPWITERSLAIARAWGGGGLVLVGVAMMVGGGGAYLWFPARGINSQGLNLLATTPQTVSAAIGVAGLALAIVGLIGGGQAADQLRRMNERADEEGAREADAR